MMKALYGRAALLLAAMFCTATLCAQTTRAAAERDCAIYGGQAFTDCVRGLMERPEPARAAGDKSAPVRSPAPPMEQTPQPASFTIRVSPRSLSDFLNDGWRIESFTHDQVFVREREAREYGNRVETVAGTIAIASIPKSSQYRFLLSKDRRWAVCTVTTAIVVSNGPTESTCILLN